MAAKKRERKPREDGTYGVPVSFRSYDKYLLDYADTQGGFSSYVKRLIYEDMQKHREKDKEKDQTPLEGAELISILLKMASTNNIQNLADLISPEYLKQFQSKSAEEKEVQEASQTDTGGNGTEETKEEAYNSTEKEQTRDEEEIDTSVFVKNLFGTME